MSESIHEMINRVLSPRGVLGTRPEDIVTYDPKAYRHAMFLLTRYIAEAVEDEQKAKKAAAEERAADVIRAMRRMANKYAERKVREAREKAEAKEPEARCICHTCPAARSVDPR